MDDLEEEIIEKKSVEDEMFYHGAKVLKYSICYPEIKQGQSKERINTYYVSRTKRQERYVKSRLFKETTTRFRRSLQRQVPFFETEFTSEFSEEYYLTDPFFSLYEDDYEYLGGANGQTRRTSQTWFLPKGRRMRLNEFFKKKTRWRRLMIDAIADMIREQIKEEDAVYFENWELLIRRYFNPSNFYLKKEGFAVFYQETTIAPHASGVVVFTVPYTIFMGGLVHNL